MHNKTRFLRNILFKALGFLVAGVFVCVGMLADTETVSWFSSRVTSSLTVRAASEEDIILSFYPACEDIDEEETLNPDKLIIKTPKDLDFEPLIYFSVGDENNAGYGDMDKNDICRYILHINPVRLSPENAFEVRENEYVYVVPINVKLNPALDFPLRKNDVTGVIRIKYLNQFFNISTKKITFTKNYLLHPEKYNHGSGVEYTGEDFEKELQKYIVELLQTFSGSMTWPEPQNQGDGSLGSPVGLTEEQQSIIDIVAPGLRKYIDDLYGFVKQLMALLNEKMAEIDELNLRIEEYIAAIDEMNRNYAALEQEKAALEDEKFNLEQLNHRLRDRINNLEDRVRDLEDDKDALMDKVNGLKSENEELKQEIESGNGSAPTQPQDSEPNLEEQHSEPPAEQPTGPEQLPEEQPETPIVDRPAEEELPVEEPYAEQSPTEQQQPEMGSTPDSNTPAEQPPTPEPLPAVDPPEQQPNSDTPAEQPPQEGESPDTEEVYFEQPPALEPPLENQPADTPAEQLPAEQSAAEEPLAEESPIKQPPSEQQPEFEQPSAGETPDTQEFPETDGPSQPPAQNASNTGNDIDNTGDKVQSR